MHCVCSTLNVAYEFEMIAEITGTWNCDSGRLVCRLELVSIDWWNGLGGYVRTVVVMQFIMIEWIAVPNDLSIMTFKFSFQSFFFSICSFWIQFTILYSLTFSFVCHGLLWPHNTIAQQSNKNDLWLWIHQNKIDEVISKESNHKNTNWNYSSKNLAYLYKFSPEFIIAHFVYCTSVFICQRERDVLSGKLTT